MKDGFEPLNQKIRELDISGATLESTSINRSEAKEETEEERNNKINPSLPSGQIGFEKSSTNIPHQSSFSEGVFNLEHEPSMKRLPHCHNRGIPKTTYEHELSSKVRYPMSNYVSNHHLFESNKSFVNQLSIIVILNNVQEALADPRWKAAMNEEMKSLQKKKKKKNETWELVDWPLGKKPIGCCWKSKTCSKRVHSNLWDSLHNDIFTCS